MVEVTRRIPRRRPTDDGAFMTKSVKVRKNSPQTLSTAFKQISKSGSPTVDCIETDPLRAKGKIGTQIPHCKFIHFIQNRRNGIP